MKSDRSIIQASMDLSSLKIQVKRMVVAEELQFYRTSGHYTDPIEFRDFLQSLPDDIEEIVRFIKRIMIHPIEARSNHVRFNYQKALRSQVDYRSVNDVLSNPNVHALLSQQTLEVQSTASQRGIFSCDHQALVFTSILRLKGKPVRARCGFATYLVPDCYTPHWICEVHDAETQSWKMVDPDQVIFNFEPGRFLSAGKLWLILRNSQLEVDKIVPDYRTGIDEVKYRLLNDINALMKNELLNYDWMIKEAAPRKPEIFSKLVSKLDPGELSLLDGLAEFSSQPDLNLFNICEKYKTYIHAENLYE